MEEGIPQREFQIKMKDNVILKKSYAFSVAVVRLYQWLCGNYNEHFLFRQLVRSGTSIGANVAEAVEAQSKRDFAAKMSIALKETSETEYWLRLLRDAGYLSKDSSMKMLNDCREIKRILVSIVRTSKSTEKGMEK